MGWLKVQQRKPSGNPEWSGMRDINCRPVTKIGSPCRSHPGCVFNPSTHLHFFCDTLGGVKMCTYYFRNCEDEGCVGNKRVKCPRIT